MPAPWIYHGEVSGDSDGPVEWCWPVPEGRAAEIAAGFPDLTLRAEPAHQEASVRQEKPGRWGAGSQIEVAVGALFAGAAERKRHPSGDVRGVLVPSADAHGTGPYVEFAPIAELSFPGRRLAQSFEITTRTG
jgi:hypothetical protein